MGGFMLHGVFPWIIDGTIYFQKLLQDHAKLLTWDKQMLTWCGKPCCFFFFWKHHLVMKFTFQSFHFTREQMHTAQCEAQQAGKYLDPPLVLVTAGCPAWGKSDIKLTERSFFSVSLTNTFRVFRVIHFNKTWNSFYMSPWIQAQAVAAFTVVIPECRNIPPLVTDLIHICL